MLPVSAKGEFAHVTLLFNRQAKRLTMAVLLALMASPLAAQSGASNPVQQMALGMLDLLRPSVSGSYMAGQQALEDLRTDEAARYFSDAAQADWDNIVLVERAFIALAADGQIGRAASTAHRSAAATGGC